MQNTIIEFRQLIRMMEERGYDKSYMRSVARDVLINYYFLKVPCNLEAKELGEFFTRAF
jgi:hypothetical protein